MLLTVYYIYKIRRKGKKNKNEDTSEQDFELPFFDLATIVIATNGFSDANKLGEGGFGPVYKGTLSDGKEIAVKKLSKSYKQGLEEFKNEVILCTKLQHRNLVKVLGCFALKERRKCYSMNTCPTKA